MCGVTHSGKTYFLEKVAARFSGKKPKIISSRRIHDFLNTYLAVIFRDDNTLAGSRFRIRNIITKIIQIFWLVFYLFWFKNTVVDSANLAPSQRQKITALARFFRRKIIIVFVNPPKNDINYRVRLADRRNQQNGESPAWEDLFKQQITRLRPPQLHEADNILEINHQNQDEILAELSRLIG